MGHPLFQVDAFTATPYRGNPAAVCLLDGPAPAGWMQDVAREMNLSETAFLHPANDGFDLRWFTPTVEVDLCGHATLASAHVLWETGRLPTAEPARFHTRGGLLTAVRGDDMIEMDFPARPAAPAEPPPGLEAALGVPLRHVAKTKADYLVEVESARQVRDLRPDLTSLARLPLRGVMVTSRSDDDASDFVSRFFAPVSGIPEDPVTGSAHCCLGPYWGAKLGKRSLVGHQASARAGVVRVRLAGDRVWLGGRAVTVLRGELTAT
ncbi:MAG: PhzF family phenazine biosynthesis protein [SAR202 cluster bacterium]|nr:PhzF family phenazine biosynthesis protein [SAR202 cluster bacterium]